MAEYQQRELLEQAAIEHGETFCREGRSIAANLMQKESDGDEESSDEESELYVKIIDGLVFEYKEQNIPPERSIRIGLRKPGAENGDGSVYAGVAHGVIAKTGSDDLVHSGGVTENQAKNHKI